MVRIVHGGPVSLSGVKAGWDREIVGNRYGLTVSDEKSVIRAGDGRPAAHARGHSGLHQVNRFAVTELETLAVAREVSLMRTPTQFGRLRTFRDETVHRPGVNELVRFLRNGRHLRIAFGDMDHSQVKPLRQIGPVFARPHLSSFELQIGRNIDHGLLHQM